MNHIHLLLCLRNNLSTLCVLTVLCFQFQADAASKKAIVTQTSPCFASYYDTLLPVAFLNRGDTVIVDSTIFDSTSNAWHRISRNTQLLFVSARALRWALAPDTTRSQIPQVTDDALARKRRLALLSQHKEWPRRIRKMVHDGNIGLGMMTEQLTASWGEPHRKGTTFILGIGDHQTWFFTDRKGDPITVSLQNGEVIGWLNGLEK